ncbi:MAG: hypothetical protein H6747_09400 [Deltaproteobacteria bacterium]|nr:hypothetical protein [Deltaproteobacteria bacterium]
MRKFLFTAGLCAALATTLTGCEKKQAEPAAKPEAAAEEAPAAEAAKAEEAPAAEAAKPAAPAAEKAPAAPAKVEVSAEGTNFDPPVQKAQLPDDVWYCDMGTVHYARKTEGDGTCPRCKMKLVHNAAAAPKAEAAPAGEAAPAAEGHEGHGH